MPKDLSKPYLFWRGVFFAVVILCLLLIKVAYGSDNRLAKQSNKCGQVIVTAQEQVETNVIYYDNHGRQVPGKTKSWGPSTDYIGTFCLVGKNRAVTNHHVIEKTLVEGAPTEPTVALNFCDGSSQLAAVVAFDEEKDLALLEFSEPVEEFYTLADSAPVGSLVTMGGYMLGYDYVEVTGKLTNRKPYNKLLRVVDDNIYEGMSGGPVVNQEGQLVGVNAATASTQAEVVKLENLRQFLEKNKE